MNEIEIFEITRDAIFTLLKIVSPIIITALAVGLIIGIFQALTIDLGRILYGRLSYYDP